MGIFQSGFFRDVAADRVTLYHLLCAEIVAILIKSNNNIKGIKVGYKEFVISQYADDNIPNSGWLRNFP